MADPKKRPPRVQTRRTVSVSGLCYQRFKAGCKANGLAMAAVTEKMLTEFMDAMGWPEETVLVQRSAAVKREEREQKEAASGHWTF